MSVNSPQTVCWHGKVGMPIFRVPSNIAARLLAAERRVGLCVFRT